MATDASVVAAVPARLDSTRLPRKQLRPLGGRALLWYLTERMAAVPDVDTVVVATTDRVVDDPLVKWAEDREVDVFRGAHEDLLGRFQSVTRAYDADIVVRANGDNPLLSPGVTSRGIEVLRAQNLEFTTGKRRYTNLPVGIGPEVLTAPVIEKLAAATDDPHHREHVTTHIFDNPEEFRWEPIPVPAAWEGPDLSVTVDTAEDLATVAAVVERLPDRNPSDWSVEEVIDACRTIGDDGTSRS